MKAQKNVIKPVVQSLISALEERGLSVSVGGDWLNVSRKDGLNCEFYPCYDARSEFEVYTATYTIDGVERELDFELPDAQDEMVWA